MTEPRHFAEDTEVPVGRTRGEIDELLREWKCNSIAWGENYDTGETVLRFVFEDKGARYTARFNLKAPTREDLERELDARTGPGTGSPRLGGQNREVYLRNQLDRRPRALHRLLLLKLKADLNAVRVGLTRVETVFLPYLEDAKGQTVAETIAPHLSRFALPPAGGTGGK